MSLRDDHRYFLVRSESATHLALNRMESIGERLLGALQIAEEESCLPLKITHCGAMRGFALFPEAARSYIEPIFSAIMQTLCKAESEIFVPQRVVVLPVNDIKVGNGAPLSMRNAGRVLEALGDVAPELNDLGYDPNLMQNLSRIYGIHGNQDPNRAVLTVDTFEFRPMAHKVFDAWIFQLPPYIPQFGNTYVPPDSKPISSADVDELTIVGHSDLAYFKNQHHFARNALLAMGKLELQQCRY